MVRLLVMEATEGVHVELDIVARREVHQHCVARHAVAVVVDVVLVIHCPHLLAILSDRHQDLLHVLGAHINTEHVAT